MRTKHSALLLRHQHFLSIDFVELGRGPTIACQVWVTNMEMAISVFKDARGNFCTQESLCLLCTPLDTPINQPLPPTQTGIASSTNDSQHIRLHSIWFAASSRGRTVRLPRALYTKHHSCNHQLSCSKCLLISPTSLQRKCTPMGKTRHQLFPLCYPTVAPWPYDKIMAHLNCLHIQKKTVATTGSSLI
jgi:hypothetical protein